MPDSSGSIDLGDLTPEQQEAVDKLAEERGGDVAPDEGDKPKVFTAFTIIVDLEGNPQVAAYGGDDLTLQAQPNQDLVFGFLSVVLKDLQAVETARASAEMTADYLARQAQEMQRQVMQQQEAQRIASGLNLPGGRR